MPAPTFISAKTTLLAIVVSGLCATVNACVTPASGDPAPTGPISPAPPVPASTGPTAADAAAFVARAEAELAAFGEEAARISWVQANFITDDTLWLAARVGARGTELGVRLATEAKAFDALALDPDLARKLRLLKLALTLPAPAQDGAAQQLAEITTGLEATYATGKFLHRGRELTLGDMEDILAKSRDPQELQTMWAGWRTISVPMRARYQEMAQIANAGAQELGFADVGALWRSNYDMDPDEFAAMVDRLWREVKPLYEQLHCHVRTELNGRYGEAVQPATGPIRADLLGNMWAQSWTNIYDLVAPPAASQPYDLTRILVGQRFDAQRMARQAEGFFTSLGLAPLPDTFWRRSLFVKPQDREVVCHASAWNLDSKNDVRIKMCTKVNEVDFVTVHHELGHNFYQRAYQNQSTLHQAGANDGFHEAIGDMVALSITPSYLQRIGLIAEEPGPDADLGLLMNQALAKVAFLPFGLLVDKWRWQVFSGETPPEQYNAAWWALRTQYQGIMPPIARSEADFDPGAKFHIPGNTPYMRYFLAHILQFQFHKAACAQAGWTGPLHRCSIYDNKQVGARFNAMLEMGASRPWPEALEAFTGSREMDATAIVDYFAPLMTWLQARNQGRACGW